MQELQKSLHQKEREIANLRERYDLLMERNEHLRSDCDNYLQQMDSLFKTNKMLRSKIKAQEHLLFGRSFKHGHCA